ncbi:MAG TPA: ThuA domain-containing protein [Methylomirabilota bacterium]|nr:ThuA domain-containing protein [Methylomirabilota bacterium]
MNLIVRLLCVLTVAPFIARAAELPVRSGLVFWLDPTAQNRLREASNLPSYGNVQPADFLFDSSSTKLQSYQPSPERRPVFQADTDAAYLKFDGKDDAVVFSGSPRQVKECTVFILAAPKSNPGNFSGMFASAAFGKNDYTSGLNIDLGPAKTPDLSVINVESAGSTGAQDLLTPGFFNATDRPFGAFHLFTVRSAPGTNGTAFFMDGFDGGKRTRRDSMISLDHITVGARIYSNDGNETPFVQGAFDGAIADVLVYDRALPDNERKAVEQFLLAKTVALEALLKGVKGHPLEMVENPPAVQMFVPGFSVSELPLKIGNLNNVRYRHDGKVVALGYDGRIYLLTDSNGDGLEDKAEFFWDKTTMRGPIGMALTARHDPRGDGVFVASKGKISFFIDKDRDGKAEEEQVVAGGWKEIFQAVDTVGLAIDPKDGSIYFGRGTANFANGYLIDPATGKSGYNINEAFGTIQRLSADFKTQETICTGVRFTCALAFNRHGDLFATEQEGATWLPNGNPFDELLHIERGKHYGFPPRHPKHLPDVRDQPAVYEYGPQHQSTVGMVFNEPVNGGPIFGPAHWEGDALVCGESRGKLYRTRLAKTELGYVALNYQIASLTNLLVDACVTPAGDLLLACHSGPPDWGTGPSGEGRIFKVRYTAKALPQPVHAWASASDEFRIAFDKPLNPGDWANAKSKIKIETGEFVGAGDRFEIMRPGYQVIRDQMSTPRRWVELLGFSISNDRRTMILRVPRVTHNAPYAITLPLPEAWRVKGPIEQSPEIDLVLTLNGVVATAGEGSGSQITTVLPHPSLSASAELMKGSAEHEAFFKAASSSNAKVTLAGKVDISNPYVPTVQPGSKLDWDMSADKFASTRFDLVSASGKTVPLSAGEGSHRGYKHERDSASSRDVGLYLAKGELKRQLSTARAFVPWTEFESAPAKGLAAARTDVKGNWLKGREIFNGEAGCATCHKLRNEGFAFGPDLSNLVHRDRESVLKDIFQPSATINPDQPGSVLHLNNGVSISGMIASANAERVVLALPAGASNVFARSEIKSIEPVKGSLMPEGFRERLTNEQVEDLLTYLLVSPLEPAPITRTDPPMPGARSAAELAAVLQSAEPTPDTLKPLRILLVAGPKDHGPDEHDYPLWIDRWSRLLPLAEKVEVKSSMGFPKADLLDWADVSVFYNANPGWSGESATAMDKYHTRGGGAVYIHYAVDGGKDPAGVAERVGLAFTLGSRFRHGELDLVFSQPQHPITKGFPTLRFTDESYWAMRGDTSRLTVLANSKEDNAPQPQLWTLQRNQSRIVGCIPGHYTWTFDDPLFRVLVFRSIVWAAKDSHVDRLAPLATIGARLKE